MKNAPQHTSDCFSIKTESHTLHYLRIPANLRYLIFTDRLTSTQHLDEEEKEADPDEESNKMSLVSAKEERDLQILLDKFTIEVHDLADFQQRLQNELTSLEVCFHFNWSLKIIQLFFECSALCLQSCNYIYVCGARLFMVNLRLPLHENGWHDIDSTERAAS